jgi:glutaredoxin 2
MNVALKIKDETAQGQVVSEAILIFPSERITIQELIESRVSQEVDAYNKKAGGEFKGFVQPSESEKILNGFKLTKGRQLNFEKQKNTAITAFKSNNFFLLVNDKQVTEVDEVIFITPKTLVVFLKLVPLIGG